MARCIRECLEPTLGHALGLSALRPVWTEVSSCLHSQTGRRIGQVLLGAALLKLGLRLCSGHRRRQRRQRWADARRDVVILHQFERGTNMPNLSPFALKLETWLRMTGVRYIIDNEETQSPATGKSPWITLNGEEFSDSELVIDHLTSHFKTELSDALSAREHAVGRAVQTMLDEHAMPAVAYKRYVMDGCRYIAACFARSERNLLTAFGWLLISDRRQWGHVNGIGRYTEPELMFLLNRDLQALSDIIGEKPYLLAEKPTEYDAAVFADLTQVIYGCAPEVEGHVREHHAPLVRYHERMCGAYWPDWDRCRAE